MGPIRSEYADDADMRDLVELFVTDMPERVRALEEAFVSGEREALQRIAHQLKGACGGYGFGTVGESAARLESALKGSDELTALRKQVDELVSMCSRVVA